ncbi:hypothetical protein AO398_00380 [Methylobacterium sp. GXS13]|uniref:hypothetical protein n=1 Tax=Methylobacterium sp. GXS13 TaxID=1730094 RepID=UPI00071BDFBD|nr:hypothetical protein [Methylobacterium sp. GXS13]KST61181.1 hypothetical protein AO398_00380 [Methylobacterium sp. GXS13]
MSHETRHVLADVTGRGTQALMLGHFAVQDFCAGIERARVEEVDAVSAVVAELHRARRQAAAAVAEVERLRAEAAQLREDLRSAGGALAAERARADRLDGSLRRLIAGVRAHQAARAAA